MNIKQLRIDNFVLSGKSICRVAMIGKPNEIVCEDENGKIIPFPVIYKPIPLTTDWLENLDLLSKILVGLFFVNLLN